MDLLLVVEEKHYYEVNYLTVFEEQPYAVLFTGGLSEHDPELFVHFSAIRSAKPVIEMLVEWAMADKVAALSVKAQAADDDLHAPILHQQPRKGEDRSIRDHEDEDHELTRDERSAAGGKQE